MCSALEPSRYDIFNGTVKTIVDTHLIHVKLLRIVAERVTERSWY